MPNVDYSPRAIDSRLALCGELHRLGVSLRDARARPGIELPIFEAIVRALALRFRAIEDLDSTHVWTAAVYLALAVDARAPVARSLGLAPAELNVPYDSTLDFSWVSRAEPERRLLVAESEWGKAGNAAANDAEVWKDFQKLLRADAPYRVLVHSAHASTRGDLERRLADAAGRTSAPSTFLFVSLEWHHAPTVDGMRAFALRDVGGRPVRHDFRIPIE